MLNFQQRLYSGPYRARAERTMRVDCFIRWVSPEQRSDTRAKFFYRARAYTSTELYHLIGKPTTNSKAFSNLLMRLTKHTKHVVTNKIRDRLKNYVPAGRGCGKVSIPIDIPLDTCQDDAVSLNANPVIGVNNDE